MNKESSDEKLLKLIEGSAKIPPLPKFGIKLKSNKPLIPNILKLRFKLNLFNLNKILFAVSVLLTFVFFYILVSGHNIINSELLFSSLTTKSLSTKHPVNADKSSFLSLNEYLDVFSKRNIFLHPSKTNFSQEELTAKLADLVKDIRLVGIIWSSNPEVMVEDKIDSRTYLLKKGETFGKNQYKIKDVTRNSAILEIELEGEKNEYELR